MATTPHRAGSSRQNRTVRRAPSERMSVVTKYGARRAENLEAERGQPVAEQVAAFTCRSARTSRKNASGRSSAVAIGRLERARR